MQKSTRDFIKARQPYCKYVVEAKNVTLIGGGEANKCYHNAHSRLDRAKGIRFVSGWVIEPYNPVTNNTEIIQHYWNATDDGYHFDSNFSPLSKHCEYVVDMDLLSFCQLHDHELNSHLASSLLYENGMYQCVDENDDGTLSYRFISNLNTAELYRTKLSSHSVS